MPTENDTITLGSWMAFGLGNTRYKEYDATVNYVHTFGDLAVGMGYTFYYFLNTVLYQNELNWTVAYTFHLPAGITLVPSVVYYFNLGPDFENFERGTGAVEDCLQLSDRALGRRHPHLQGHYFVGSLVWIWSEL